MPEPQNKTGDKTSGTTNPDLPPELQAELKKREDVLNTQFKEKMQANDMLQKLVSDPQIQEILKARQEGREVKLVDPKAKQNYLPGLDDDSSSDQESDPADLDDLSPSELAKFIVKKVSASVGTVLKEQQKGVSEKLESFEKYIASAEGQKVKSEIEQVRSKHKDFEELRPKMAEIANQNTGLSVEELYLLARTRSGMSLVPEQTETERPSSTTARGPLVSRREKPLPPGRAGFAQALQEGLAKVLGESKLPD